MTVPRAKGSEPIPGYRLIKLLGSGGFGEVWEAEAPGGLAKAIKFVYGEIDEKYAGQEVKAFERIKAVRHPFVLSIERVEIVGGQLVIVCERADKTLLDRFKECRDAGGKGIPRPELLRYLQDAADALDYMTVQFQLQHLDIKPSNLFLVGGRVKVGDFGLVREVYNNTTPSDVGLSPAYAAPESFTGDVSRYSDQYGLAIVYQEMLTGVRPFRGRTVPLLSKQHLHGEANLSPLPGGEQPVIARALSKNPKDRFPTCSDMVHALLRVEAIESAGDGADGGTDDASGPAPAEGQQGPQEDPFRSMHYASRFVDRDDASSLETCPSSMSVGEPSAEMGMAADTRCTPEADSPEPTLFIGIGGIAGRVLLQAKRLLQARFENRSSRLPVGWLLLDTDRDTIREVTRGEVAGGLSADETVLMPLHGPEHYRPRLKELLCWIGRHWIYRIPRTRCTEGIRPLGRLALVDNADTVLSRLRRSIGQLSASLEKGPGHAHLKVIVIASVSGGTGGGCLADVSFAIRRLLREEGLEGTPVEGVLIAASSVRTEGKELASANAYATLTELDHFFDPGSSFPGDGALGSGPVEGGPPFDSLRLLDFGDILSEEGLESGAHLVAEYLHLVRGTPYGRKLEASRTRTPSSGTGPCVTSFRLARLGFPRAELRRTVAGKVCKRILARWRGGSPPPEDPRSTVTATGPIDPTAPRANPAEAGADRPHPHPRFELEEEEYLEISLERAEHALGIDPRVFLQRKIDEILDARRRNDVDEAVGRFFDQMDGLIARGRKEAGSDAGARDLERRLRDESRFHATDDQRQLGTWLGGIVEEQALRLKPAADAVKALLRELAEAAEETQSRLSATRQQRDQIRGRYLGVGTRRRVPNLLKSLRREVSPRLVAELGAYGRHCMNEAALGMREEILHAFRDRASQVADELAVLTRALEGAEQLFGGRVPTCRNSERNALGTSTEILPIEASDLAVASDAVAESFCSDRWLDDFEGRFREEVLDPHGGLAAVMAREPRFVAELFSTTMFHRVADAVDQWLEDMDAASLMIRRHGSAKEVANELRKCLKSQAFRTNDRGGRRIIVGTPNSPSGRSLRESLGQATAIQVADFVTIPEDVVLCLELEDLSLSSTAAELVARQPWLANLARKLVTREDVRWRWPHEAE